MKCMLMKKIFCFGRWWKYKTPQCSLETGLDFSLSMKLCKRQKRISITGVLTIIDAILGPFTGRAMAPLVTADFVGMDVHKAIVDNLYGNTCDYAHETFILLAFADKLVKEGRLGRKSCGDYSGEFFEPPVQISPYRTGDSAAP